ncbi:RluA family pseudouridine synthase [Bacillus seohaeanensis]|jgi:23S rRNA pseudouridine1911/1915/1917 synthase|uniref:Pseudouridine synthase n=1 Tax=Bacillus seohaeanensis TaxID=284580 RepID=A0ABW5RM49_9BACI
MKRYTLRWNIEKEDSGKWVRQFLQEQLISKRTLTAIKHDGGFISVNGEEVNVRYPLKVGEILKVVFPPERRSEGVIPEEIPVDIIYEDDDILICDKPAGMNTIPSGDRPYGNLVNALTSYYEHEEIASTVHIVTRLDRNTSGLVLVAKHRHVHHLFSLQQKERGIKRRYEAFAEGCFTNELGTINKNIGRKESSIIEREVREDGQYACTHYRVLRQKEHFAHLILQLETGRTHQIRVHLASIGHPLVGDDLYGGSLALLSRQALHCVSLGFFHPVQKKWMQFKSMLPSDLSSLLNEQTKRD